jgi:iron complex transport system substrate-binding protein
MTRQTFDRRSLLRAVGPALAMAVPLRPARAQGPREVTDLLGRTVTLPRPARRIVLGQARHVLALSLLHPDPVSLVVGWGGDLRQLNPPDYASVRARFPAADAVPLVGRSSVDTLSVESIVAARPDVVLLSRGGSSGSTAELAARLNGFGVPTLVIDFFVDPLRDTLPSIAILGAVIGAEERARDFAAFYTGRLQRIADRLGSVAARPKVFIHAHAGGTPCCGTAGSGAYNGFVQAAGGRNLGAEILPGVIGSISLEQLLASDPAVYVATGGPFAARGGFPLGAGVAPEAALSGLRAVLQRERLTGLSAIRNGRGHGMWHGFNDTPAHIVLVEALARAIHPVVFAEIDPAATRAELNRRFLSVPMEGTYWLDLGADAG